MSCRYKYVKPLGEGAYGIVSEVIDSDGEKWAFKKFPDINDFLDSLSEIDIESRISSPYLIKLKELQFNECSSDRRLESHDGAIVLPKFDGDLLSLSEKSFINSKNYTELIRKCFYSIAAGTKCLHLNGYFHRDIKLENVFYFVSPTGEYNFVLADYGLSFPAEDVNEIYKISLSGSIVNYPPEAIEKGELTNKTDVWALGVCIYEFVTRDYVNKYADEKDQGKLYRSVVFNPDRIRRKMLERVKSPSREYVSMVELVVRCLDYSREDRISITELMQDPIFEDFESGNCTYISHSKFGNIDFDLARKELATYLTTITRKFSLRSLMIGWYNYLLFQSHGHQLKHFVTLSKLLFREELLRSITINERYYLGALVKMMDGKIYHSFYRTHPKDYVSIVSSLILVLKGEKSKYLEFLQDGRSVTYTIPERNRNVMEALKDLKRFL